MLRAVVGTGTHASCTFAALSAAVSAGGEITFDCGAAPVTIAVTATLHLPTTKNTVLDGGRKVTLDGGGKVLLMIPPKQVKNAATDKVVLGFSSIFWNTAWTRRQPPTTLASR